MADDSNRAGILAEFVAMSNASPEQATQYLEAHDWDLMAASNSFFQDRDEEGQSEPPQQAQPAVPDNYTGPRTLDGRPAPQATSSRASRKPTQPKRKGVATLGSLGGGSSHHHDDDDDDLDDDYDDDDDDDGRGNLFAGGEKSGLAVQDPKQQESGPRKLINDILAKAKANSAHHEGAEEAGPSRQSYFRGTGVTLGGDGVESRSIPDPMGAQPSNMTPQERVLHIWEDGFSIDDGELRRFDDPANQQALQMIRSGRAPLHLMNVQNNQPVDVKLHQHEGPYTPQPKKYRPFEGTGQRLGSPVPGAGSSNTPSQPAAAPSSSASAGASSAALPNLDPSQPTITIRIQLPDGSRLPARFNATHTVGDVYSFVQASSPDTSSRSWVLATTFPNKEHTDKDLVLGDMSEFKKGGTAVVKWT
ncbi:hypothetical protein NLU13_9585 [Sarocladium strictum]|uniref:UBX domain-containing protein 1 n=1 Tax=Sarocladium strictum TaxID=5046 RepID=A0AA39L4J9_SARSR|nr:hypothetical protein NLU13_9585 [Sarocladium strictum]